MPYDEQVVSVDIFCSAVTIKVDFVTVGGRIVLGLEQGQDSLQMSESIG